MSYEGWEQYLCKNGHYWEEDCDYSYGDVSEKTCPHCKEKAVWNVAVDETNGEGMGYIPMDQLLVKKEVVQTCNMGHSHMVEPAVYRIPAKEETKELRTFRDENGNLFLLKDYNNDQKTLVGQMW